MKEDEVNAIIAEARPRVFAIAKAKQRAQRANRLVYESYLAAESGKAFENGDVERHRRITASFPKVKIWSGARKLRVSIPDDEQGMKARWRAFHGVGKRDAISGFSAASRRRMLGKMAEIRREAAMPIFITLTIPAEIYAGVARAKEWLRAWFKRLVRSGKDSACILWKIEPHESGIAHFHCLVWGTGFIPWQTITATWVAVMTGEKLENWPITWGENASRDFSEWAKKNASPIAQKGLAASTKVEAIRSHRGIMFYCAKYCAKEVEGDNLKNPGRFWGVLGAEFFPAAECEVEVVDFKTAYSVIGWLRRKIRSRCGWEPWVEKVMTLVSEDADDAWRFLQ